MAEFPQWLQSGSQSVCLLDCHLWPFPPSCPSRVSPGMVTQREGWRSLAACEAASLCRAVEDRDGEGRFRSGPPPELGIKTTEYGIFLAPGSMEGNHEPAEKA